MLYIRNVRFFNEIYDTFCFFVRISSFKLSNCKCHISLTFRSPHIYRQFNTSTLLCRLFDLGQQGDFWRRAEIHLVSAVNYQVVIEGMSGPGYQGDIAMDDVSFTPICRPDSTATISPTVPTGTPPPGCQTGQFRYEDISPQRNKQATILCTFLLWGQLPPGRADQFILKVELSEIRRLLVISQ